MAIIRVGADQVEEFVGLVAQMNPPGRWDQDLDTERQLLLGTHPLCEGVEVRGYLARFGPSTVGRIGVTLPHDSDHAHIGFLQAPSSGPVARSLFDTAAAVAAQHGRRVLLGPVDGTPWYRHWLTLAPGRGGGVGPSPLSPERYLGEPVDQPHHRDLWYAAGFDDWMNRPSLLLDHAPEAPSSGVVVVHPHRKELAATLAQAPELLLRSRAQDPVSHSPSAGALAGMLRGLERPWVWAVGADGVLPREGSTSDDARVLGLAVAVPDRLPGLSRRRLGVLPAAQAPRRVLTHLAADDPGVRRALLAHLLTELGAGGVALVCPPWLEPMASELHDGPTTVLAHHVLLRRKL